jgi:hypothetical protein
MAKLRKLLLAEIDIKKPTSRITQAEWNDIFYKNLSEEFLEEFNTEIDIHRGWTVVSARSVLSEYIIEKYKDKINWHNISTYQVLSENFIKKYKKFVDWKSLSKKDKEYTETFLIEFQNEMNFNLYFNSYESSYKIIKKFITKMDMKSICDIRHLHLTEKEKQDIQKMIVLKTHLIKKNL